MGNILNISIARYSKDLSDVVYRLTSNGIAAHYDYAPFGAITRAISHAVPAADITTLNPFRFSSEYHDDTLGLVYYNYRLYNPMDGRWNQYDFIEDDLLNTYLFIANNSIKYVDYLGLVVVITYVTPDGKKEINLPRGGTDVDFMNMLKVVGQEDGKICYIRCGGHGNQKTLWINGEWDGSSFGAKENDNTLKIRINRSGNALQLIQNKPQAPATITDITPILMKLLKEGATVDFNSCLSANGDCNIAKGTSQIFKDVTVKGSRKYAEFGIEEPHIRWPKVYKNGVEQ